MNNTLIDKNAHIHKTLRKILEKNKYYYKKGDLASYIPELKKVDPTKVGLSLVNVSGKSINIGDYETKFSIQSISKILTLILALMDNGIDHVFRKVGVEFSGRCYNSINCLNDEGKPFNPMINAGAITVTSMIKGKDVNEKFKRIINLFKKISKNNNLQLDEEIYLSEKKTGNLNRALAYYLKENNLISGNVEKILDLYFKQCSILVTTFDLANIGSVLANDGVDYESNEVLISKDIVRLLKGIMLTCGLYDESGKFAVKVGLPAKSGVGGGILAVYPKKFGIGTYSPSLNKYGNSLIGIRILKDIVKNFG